MADTPTSSNDEARRLIDEALSDLKNVNLVEAADITDLLLDIRLALEPAEISS